MEALSQTESLGLRDVERYHFIRVKVIIIIIVFNNIGYLCLSCYVYKLYNNNSI